MYLKTKQFTVLAVAISFALYALSSCKRSLQTDFDQLSKTLIGTWGVDKSAVIEKWNINNLDSLCATTYLFNDKGDSVYLSSSYVYKKDEKIYLDIINNVGKMKLYYLKTYDAPYFQFEAITKEFYPTSIKYKMREAHSNSLESTADGFIDGANKHYDFKMYKIK